MSALVTANASVKFTPVSPLNIASENATMPCDLQTSHVAPPPHAHSYLLRTQLKQQRRTPRHTARLQVCQGPPRQQIQLLVHLQQRVCDVSAHHTTHQSTWLARSYAIHRHPPGHVRVHKCEPRDLRAVDVPQRQIRHERIKRRSIHGVHSKVHSQIVTIGFCVRGRRHECAVHRGVDLDLRTGGEAQRDSSGPV